eukprot:TRINITY_DN20101_c0_g1_i1.p1 TRINITY_DN20101_c0_g1~~TRINITY_DN20101_c0_g1_i1.p1  ORF type:complete len:268 (+),score=30.27 TRINITY_DN20101_c0_g1_i1:35-805(+)
MAEYDEEDLQKLEFATSYPFPRPTSTYLFHCGTGAVEKLTDWEGFLSGEDGVERTPVIACGSNAAPQQLKRKFNGEDGVIPVVKAVLYDHDSVYCPLLASYGSVTATLARSPASELDCHVTLLTPGQLKLMNKTEGGYDLVKLHDTKVILEGGALLTSIHAYIHKVGYLISNGMPIALKEQPCRKRNFVAITQREALDHVAAMVRQEGGDDFILAVIYKKKDRSLWTQKITHSALPYDGPHEKVIECSSEASVITW